MSYEYSVLRTYSEAGIRSAEEWLTFGRAVIDGTPPLIRKTLADFEVCLFTRDQTRSRPQRHSHAARFGGGAPVFHGYSHRPRSGNRRAAGSAT